MQTLKKNMGLIIVVVVFGLALWAYTTFFRTDNSISTKDQTAEQVGADVLNLYSRLQSVTLDQNLFSTQLYKYLVDFSSAIPTQPVGRTNPFDTIGRD